MDFLAPAPGCRTRVRTQHSTRGFLWEITDSFWWLYSQMISTQRDLSNGVLFSASCRGLLALEAIFDFPTQTWDSKMQVRTGVCTLFDVKIIQICNKSLIECRKRIIPKRVTGRIDGVGSLPSVLFPFVCWYCRFPLTICVKNPIFGHIYPMLPPRLRRTSPISTVLVWPQNLEVVHAMR